MQLYGPSPVPGMHALHGPHSTRPPHAPHSPPASARSAGDQLDISAAGLLASQVHDLPEIRSDLVARVKAQIQSGTYETGDKLDVAVDRMLDELA